ncbi:MAG: GGDEF domain-containing protein, partial [Sulfolobales archaeon]
MLQNELKTYAKREFLSQLSIEPYYQPIVDIVKSDVFGYEALSRFRLENVPVKPIKVFKMAENIGFLPELDLMCRKLAIESFSGMKGYLFINVFPDYLVSEYIGKGHTLSYLSNAGLSPSRVVLELNEAVRVQDMSLLQKAIKYYRELGFGIAIDDIGTGFNSINQLLELEGLLDYVKIPRELVDGVSKSKIKYNLIKVLSEVCTNIGAKPIYEGLEKEEDLMTIYHDFSAQLVQGFYFSEPLPASKARDFTPNVKLAKICNGNCLNGRRLNSLRFQPTEKFHIFMESVENSVDRYVLLQIGEDRYLVDLWRLKSVIDSKKRNLYHYKNLIEVIEKEKSLFLSFQSIPILRPEKTDIKNLFDLIVNSKHQLFLLEESDHIKVVERHNLLDYFYRTLAKELADVNPLTYLPGNRLIEEKIKELGSKEEFWVCYMDLDNFKAFNDAYGFYAGDQMIKRVGFLLDNFRRLNIDHVFVGHIGGDDFVVLLWDMSLEIAK